MDEEAPICPTCGRMMKDRRGTYWNDWHCLHCQLAKAKKGPVSVQRPELTERSQTEAANAIGNRRA